MKDMKEIMSRAFAYAPRDKNPKELIELLSTLFVLLHKVKVYSAEINSPSFYEHHSFMNLLAGWLETACYDVKERIKVLHGTIPSDIKEKLSMSKIKDEKVSPTDPIQMYKVLAEDLKMLGEMCSVIFQRNAKEGIAGTVALVTGLAAKADHFHWETGVMAGNRMK